MLDNQLIILLLNTINPQLTAAGIPGTPIAASYQPTQQGVYNEPAAYLHKVGDVARGWPEKTYVWDDVLQQETYTETQIYETSFQISSLAIQWPGNVTQMTASDVLNLILYTLQNDITIQTLQAQGVGIYKVGDIRNPYFIDDVGRFEANPSLDFTLVHKQIISVAAPYTTDVEVTILPVT